MDAATVEKYIKAGSIAGRARDYGATLIKEGVRLVDVAAQVEAFVRKEGGSPAFPCCISLNADAAHYTPAVADATTFKAGDLVKLDVGVQVDGFIGDTARTVEVGTTVNAPLMEAAQRALDAALGVVRPDVAIREISTAIEQTIRSHGFQPVSNLTGHSVDQYHQHAGLSIPNIAATARGSIPANTAVAIEPFATDGAGSVRDAAGGNIYHFGSPRPQRDPLAKQALKFIQESHPDLPFAGRWVANAVPENKVAYAMRLLERTGAVKHYPILREVGNGMVSQFEHTVLVLPDRTIVTTRT